MQSILEKLYYGEIKPCEEPAPATEKYIKNHKEICDCEEQLLAKYPDCEDIINKYKDALQAEAQCECEADFERGFVLGILLMIDVISSD